MVGDDSHKQAMLLVGLEDALVEWRESPVVNYILNTSWTDSYCDVREFVVSNPNPLEHATTSPGLYAGKWDISGTSLLQKDLEARRRNRELVKGILLTACVFHVLVRSV